MAYPSPSSSTISPAWRASAWATSTIFWPAPAQPAGVTPRSAAVTASTGLDLAAMIPLKLGYRGSTTPAVTDTTAGNGQVTSS